MTAAAVLCDQVAREAEQVAADERRPERTCEVAAEQKRRSRPRAPASGPRRRRKATIGPTRSVSGAKSSARPGTVVAHVRLTPSGAQTACVTNGFCPWRIACGHQANDQMKICGSYPNPTYCGPPADERQQPEVRGTRSASSPRDGRARPPATSSVGHARHDRRSYSAAARCPAEPGGRRRPAALSVRRHFVEWAVVSSVVAAGRRFLPRGWGDLGRQMAIWFGFALVYQLARAAGDRDPAQGVRERPPGRQLRDAASPTGCTS